MILQERGRMKHLTGAFLAYSLMYGPILQHQIFIYTFNFY
jgi:hypothetical protein